jgi:hypothetical protein
MVNLPHFFWLSTKRWLEFERLPILPKRLEKQLDLAGPQKWPNFQNIKGPRTGCQERQAQWFL